MAENLKLIGLATDPVVTACLGNYYYSDFVTGFTRNGLSYLAGYDCVIVDENGDVRAYQVRDCEEDGELEVSRIKRVPEKYASWARNYTWSDLPWEVKAAYLHDVNFKVLHAYRQSLKEQVEILAAEGKPVPVSAWAYGCLEKAGIEKQISFDNNGCPYFSLLPIVGKFLRKDEQDDLGDEVKTLIAVSEQIPDTNGCKMIRIYPGHYDRIEPKTLIIRPRGKEENPWSKYSFILLDSEVKLNLIIKTIRDEVRSKKEEEAEEKRRNNHCALVTRRMGVPHSVVYMFGGIIPEIKRFRDSLKVAVEKGGADKHKLYGNRKTSAEEMIRLGINIEHLGENVIHGTSELLFEFTQDYIVRCFVEGEVLDEEGYRLAIKEDN